MLLRFQQPGAPSTAIVKLHVRDLGRLFNPLDYSPFWERDLAQDAASFIEAQFREKRAADVWQLHVYAHCAGCPHYAQERADCTADLQAALRHHYVRLAESARSACREQLRLGQLALLGGVALFVACSALRAMLAARIADLPSGFDEGISVLAWIALWKSVDLMAFGWVPHLKDRRLYERLARTQVTLHCEQSPACAALAAAAAASPHEPRG